MTVRRFQKRPVIVEALQLHEDNAGEVCRWVTDGGHAAFVRGGDGGGSRGGAVVIKTLEGDHLAQVGDFVIKGVQGEFYPCKPDIFEATYTAVD